MNNYNISDVEAAAYVPLIKLMKQNGKEEVLQHIYHQLISGNIDQIENNISHKLVELGITHQDKFKKAFLRDLTDYFAVRISV